MALADLLPGGKGVDKTMTMEAEAEKLAAEMGDAANPPDPYEGTELSRESLGQPEPEQIDTAPKPAAEPAGATEAPAGTPAEPAARPAADHVIPKARFDEEIAKRRIVEEREALLTRQHHELKGRLDALQDYLNAQAQPKPAEEQPPDVETDPIGALRYEQKQRLALQQQMQERAQAEQAARAEAHMMSIANNAVIQYRGQQPDIDAAINFMTDQRKMELRALGVPPEYQGVPLEQFVAWAVAQETKSMIANTLRAGRNPAEVAYAAARARGYGMAQSVAAPTAISTAVPAAPAVQLAQPAAPPKATAAVTLPPSGRPERGKLTPLQVAETGSDKEFDELFADMERTARGSKRVPIWDRRGKR